MNQRSLLKQLLFIPVFLITGFIAKSQILTEDFEGTFPNALHAAGDDPDAIWEAATNGADGGDDANFVPFTVDPHSGTGMAQFRSYDFGAGNSSILTTTSFSLAVPGTKLATFWMFRDNGYENAEDSVSLFINTTASATGATLLGVIRRNTLGNPIATSGNGWYRYSFTIPAGFNTATNYLIFEAMSDFGNNMFIDDIAVEEFAACSGTPSAGTITGPSGSCPGAQILLESTGTTSAADMVYNWQTAADVNGPWTNIPGQSSSSGATTSQTVATYYRLFVTCSNSSESDSSNVLSITLNASNICYCKPPDVSLHSFVDDFITTVEIQGTTLNSSNATDGATGYTQVPSTPANNTGDLLQLTSYNVIATIVDLGPSQVSCWFDFNNNGSYETSEFFDLTVNGTVASGNITVPSDAVVGETGFRIRARGAFFTNADACEEFGSGETEDYVVNIVANTALNGALVDIIPPPIECNSSNNSVIVKLRNSGSQDIPAGAATVGLFISGANPQTLPTQTNPALLVPGDTATLTFVCSFPVDGPNLDSAAIISITGGDVFAGDNAIVTSHVTLPLPVNAPYVQDFETPPSGWTQTYLSGAGDWVLSDTVYYYDYDPEYLLLPKSGNSCALFDSYVFGTGTATRLQSNCINIPADANNGCGYVAGFYFTQDAQYNNLDSIAVSVTSDGGNTFTRLGVVKRQDSTLTPTLAQQAYSVPQWKLYTFNVGQFAGSTVQFVFDAYSLYGNQMAIDSFFVGPKSTVANVALSGGTENGATLSAELTSCADAGGWTYYTDGNSSRYLFGIQWDPSSTGANAAARAQATAKITVDRKWYAAENAGLQMATYTMQRYWDVNLNGTVMTGPANVRFFYSQREFDSINLAKTNFITATGGTDEGFKWFKTVSGAFVPSPSSVNYDSVVNDLELQDVNTTGATINGVLYAQFNGITSFSGGTAASGVGPSTPLPVGLLSFTAQRTARVNKLSWTTTLEINTDKFVIEHSTDGRNFISIGDLAAAGNSSNNINYSFIHNTPIMGVNFYRLKVVERNGNIKYSDVRSVRNEGTADIAIYPNPVKDVMLVNITSDRTDKATITITDMNGKLLQIKTSALIEGSNYININTSTIGRGTYIVKIQLNDDMIVRKVNKL